MCKKIYAQISKNVFNLAVLLTNFVRPFDDFLIKYYRKAKYDPSMKLIFSFFILLFTFVFEHFLPHAFHKVSLLFFSLLQLS